MVKREAACSCGQLQAVAEGEPIRVSVCHCLACQRRTGSAFGFQARYLRERVSLSGQSHEFDVVAVPVGAFADPAFAPPRRSVYESRKHNWVTLPSGVEHHA
ncbi:MAG: GFA family protein [Solirubrobacteraceae bacterium]